MARAGDIPAGQGRIGERTAAYSVNLIRISPALASAARRGARMPLTPADIHNMNFKKSAIGRRGYDGEQVDALLDAVTLEMIALMEQNEVLRRQANRADVAIADKTPQNTAAAELSAADDMLYRARRSYDEAEEIARALQGRLDQARRAVMAEATVERPEADADGVLALARHTADRQVHSARREADALLLDAREKSGRIAEEARSAAQDISADSRRRDDDAKTDLQRRRAALSREVDELAGFAADYRTALTDHVRRQGQF